MRHLPHQHSVNHSKLKDLVDLVLQPIQHFNQLQLLVNQLLLLLPLGLELLLLLVQVSHLEVSFNEFIIFVVNR